MTIIRARDYVAAEPLHSPPSGPYVDPGRREEALSDALRGVELGAYDEFMVVRMVRLYDDPTLRVIVSLLERVREAGMVDLAIRIDQMLDQLVANRVVREAGYSREEPATNGPLPEGVEGRPLGRHGGGEQAR